MKEITNTVSDVKITMWEAEDGKMFHLPNDCKIYENSTEARNDPDKFLKQIEPSIKSCMRLTNSEDATYTYAKYIGSENDLIDYLNYLILKPALKIGNLEHGTEYAIKDITNETHKLLNHWVTYNYNTSMDLTTFELITVDDILNETKCSRDKANNCILNLYGIVASTEEKE